MVETELEYKLFVNRKDMKASFVRELERKKKKNKKIMREIHFKKYQLERKLEQADRELEMNFPLKSIARSVSQMESELQKSGSDLFDSRSPRGDFPGGNAAGVTVEATTVRPARAKNPKPGSQMRIFEDSSEKDRRSKHYEDFRLDDPSNFEQGGELDFKEIKHKRGAAPVESTAPREPEILDSIFDEIANSTLKAKPPKEMDRTLVDFDKSFAADKEIKTPFD